MHAQLNAFGQKRQNLGLQQQYEERFDKKKMLFEEKCVIGKGKEGSYVVSGEESMCIDFLSVGAYKYCFTTYAGQQTCLKPSSFFGRYNKEKTLFKVNSKINDTADEINANTRIHQWLSAKYLLHMSPLDKDVSYVTAMDKRDHVVKTIIVLRRLAGDLRKIRIDSIEIARIAKVVLTVIQVIHDNGYLHQDIKPMNILYEKTPDQGYAYVLADFGILESMQRVSMLMKSRQYSGTPGYISPLMFHRCEDTSQRIYPTMVRMAQLASNTIYTEQQVQDDMVFFRDRMMTYSLYSKIDLHSLGFTLFEIIEKNCIDSPKSANYIKILQFIEKLMYVDEDNDFMTAIQALQYLCRVFPVCADLQLS